MAKKEAKTAKELQDIRESAISNMSEPLRAKFFSMEEVISDLRAANIKEHYRIGGEMAEIVKDDVTYNTLNKSSPEKLLARALQIDARSLRMCRQFFDMYDNQHFTGLLQKHNDATGYRLSFAHVKYLLTVMNVVSRTEYENAAIVDSLSPQDLHTLIRRREGRETGAGPKHGIPATLTAQLMQILKFATQFRDKQLTVWHSAQHSVFENVRVADVAAIKYDDLYMLEDIAELMAVIAEFAVANSALAVSIAAEVNAKKTESESKVAEAVADDAETVAGRIRRTRPIATDLPPVQADALAQPVLAAAGG